MDESQLTHFTSVTRNSSLPTSTALVTQSQTNQVGEDSQGVIESAKKWLGSSVFGSVFSGESTAMTIQDKQMSTSILSKLKVCDSELERLYKKKDEIQKTYDVAVLETKQAESKYKNNLEFIQEKIGLLQKHMIQTVQALSEIATPITQPGVNDSQVLDAFQKMVGVLETFRHPGGVTLNQLFPHVDLSGVKMSVDYSQAIKLNKTLLDNIAAKRNEETPILRELESISSHIKHIKEETDIIRDFQSRHARHSASGDVPLVNGTPVHLVDDNHQLVQAPKPNYY